MYVVCKSNLDFHYYGTNIFVYKNIHEFVELPEILGTMIKYISTGHLTEDDLFERICEFYEVDKSDQDIFEGFERALKKLFSYGYIELSEMLSPKEISGEEGKCYPFSAMIELTNRCNLKCDHCYKDATCNNYLEINMEAIKDFCEKFCKKIRNVVITGGEITTHSHINEIIGMLSEKFQLYILSNGVRLDKIYRSLNKVKLCQISMYGYDTASFENFTHLKNGFDLFEKNLSYLSSLDVKYTLTVIITKKNINNLEKYVNKAIELGARNIAFGISVPLGRICKENKIFILGSDEKREAYFLIQELQRKYETDINFLPFETLRKAESKYENIDKFSCNAGKNSIVINARGWVRPCHMIPEDIFDEYTIDEYANDINRNFEKNYSEALSRFRLYMLENGHSVSEMQCAGFCEVK